MTKPYSWQLNSNKNLHRTILDVKYCFSGKINEAEKCWNGEDSNRLQGHGCSTNDIFFSSLTQAVNFTHYQ